MNSVVELRGIVKRFPGVVALDRVDVDLRPCEVLGLIGQNGSGKSTLVKAIAGVQEPDEGEIWVRGMRQRLASPQMAASLGIGMVHQEQSLIGSLTVAENIYLDKPSETPIVSAGIAGDASLTPQGDNSTRSSWTSSRMRSSRPSPLRNARWWN